MRRMLSILGIYQQHIIFMMLLIVMLLSMGAVQVFQSQGHGLLIEDLMTMWLMVWMTLAFHLGIMIKRQTASPSTHLLPGYRNANAAVTLIICGVLAAINAGWIFHLSSFLTPFKARIALVLLCTGVFLLTTIVGYLSVRFLVLIAYAILLLAVANVMNILDIFVHYPIAASMTECTLGMLLIIFAWRLLSLREESWEYPYVLSWPLYINSGREEKADAKQQYITKAIPLFRDRKTRWSKVRFWSGLDSENTSGLLVVLSAAAIVYEIYVLKIAGTHGFYMRPFANLFLYALLPVFITLFSNHRVLAYKEWALMLPLRRKDLANQWGDLLAMTFVYAWGLVCVLFVVVPGLLLNLDTLHSPRVWEYLMLTGVFGYMTLTWLCNLALETNSKKVLGNVFLYICLTSAESLVVPFFSEGVFLSQVIIFAAASIWFRRMACQKWEQGLST